MVCHLCLKNKKLVKSHIIPESFYKIGNKIDPKRKTISNSKNSFPKRTPIGIYDRILCNECEKRFGPWDQCGAEFLKVKINSAEHLSDKNQNIALVIHDFDYKNLKLFFLSVLWRAEVTSHYFFKRVKLGPYESAIRKQILEEDPGGPEDFSVVLANFDYSQELVPILDPDLKKWDGINAYRFYFGFLMALIKVDQQKFREPFSACIMKPNPPLYVITRSFLESSERKVMQKLAIQNQNKFGW